ncbi:hypothetical protein EMIHUDRAFT_435121, partial [Emiliania huxleyi CCMP1516]|uniref:Uncharacterized protein n=2 Tax=Emiliania huxleyi TaxID=2903 RepID=A0A0D3JSW9_EMIH1
MPQPGWGDCSYGDCNFANCATPDADELDTDGHCHGSDDDSTYGWWVRDHHFRGYTGTLNCCCGWGAPMYGVVNRCDYRKPVSEAEVSTSRRERRLGSTHGLQPREFHRRLRLAATQTKSTTSTSTPRATPTLSSPTPSPTAACAGRCAVLLPSEVQGPHEVDLRSTRATRRGGCPGERAREGQGVARRANPSDMPTCSLSVYLRSYACVAVLLFPPRRRGSCLCAFARAHAHTGLCTYVCRLCGCI